MKKLLLALVCLFGVTLTVSADKDKPISENQLPAAARQFIKTHFPKNKIAMAKQETGFFSKEFYVIFTNGDKLEFDGKGNWTQVSCKKTSSVPTAVIPAKIKSYLKTNYPDVLVRCIEKEGSNIEVKLSNGWEITFNSDYQVVDIDD